MTPTEIELKNLKETLQDTQPVGVIVNCCRTLDQVRSLLLLTEFPTLAFPSLYFN